MLVYSTHTHTLQLQHWTNASPAEHACVSLPSVVSPREVKFIVAAASKLPLVLKALPAFKGTLRGVVYWGPGAADNVLQVRVTHKWFDCVCVYVCLKAQQSMLWGSTSVRRRSPCQAAVSLSVSVNHNLR